MRDFSRRDFIRTFAAAGVALIVSPARPARAANGFVRILERALSTYPDCSPEGVAIAYSIEQAKLIDQVSAKRLVILNVAAQQWFAYDDGVNVMKGKAAVGKPSTPSPTGISEAISVVANPEWIVPSSIMKEKHWDKAWMNPAPLARYGFYLANMRGDPIAWSEQSFPGARYQLRQKPGPDNPLGPIKIRLSGLGDILLHGTNERSIYDQPDRLASHGCFRIDGITDLASWMMRGSPLIDAFRAAVGSGVRSEYPLPMRIPVLLLYMPAFPDAGGRVHFHGDPYKILASSSGC